MNAIARRSSSRRRFARASTCRSACGSACRPSSMATSRSTGTRSCRSSPSSGWGIACRLRCQRSRRSCSTGARGSRRFTTRGARRSAMVCGECRLQRPRGRGRGPDGRPARSSRGASTRPIRCSAITTGIRRAMPAASSTWCLAMAWMCRWTTRRCSPGCSRPPGILPTRMALELIPVRTNVRAFTAGIDWGRYAHGPCLAAIGHVLSPLLHTMYVASCYWFTTLKPWGSHPDIDGRWSSERLEFVHHGLEATRADKIRRIAKSEVALRTLRVCWRNRDNEFNCGRCEKCARTMFALSCCGVLHRRIGLPAAARSGAHLRAAAETERGAVLGGQPAAGRRNRCGSDAGRQLPDAPSSAVGCSRPRPALSRARS